MDADCNSDSMRADQMHIYDEVPREDMVIIEYEEDPPFLPPKTTGRSGSDKKNNNEDSSPVNLCLNREEESMFLRENLQQSGFRRSHKPRDDNTHRGIARHESAPARNNFPRVIKRRGTLEDNKLGEPQYQDPDDIRNSMFNKSSLKTQTSMPCIPQFATYEEADPANLSLGFSCEDEGEYWSISRDTFSESGNYADWPVISAPHANYPGGKPFAQSTLKKQMSTSTTSSSRTDSSMASTDIKTYYEESFSSAAESPDLPKKFARSHTKSRKAFNHYTKIVMHERETQVDLKDFQPPVEDHYSQTFLEVKDCCSCGDMVYISDDAIRLRDLLKFEQSQRMMAEQLFKLAEREVMDLQSELDDERKITERLSTELIKTKDKAKDLDRWATEQRFKAQDLEDKLNDANNRISQLEEELVETTRQKQETQRMLDTKLSQLKSKNADSSMLVDMLQADLQQSQQEINRLLERLSDVNREKSEMVSNDVHTELMRMADERAKRAELRAMALEHELRTIKQQYNNSHNDLDMYPMVKVFPNKLEKSNKSSLPDRYQIHEYPPMVPPRGGFDYTQPNSIYVQGNRPRNQSSPASPHMFRKNNVHDPDLDRSRPTNRTAGKTAKDKVRSQSKSPKRNQRITTRMNRAHSQGVADLKNKATLLSRVQSRMDTGAKSSPKSSHMTFLDRVQSKFFASKKKDAVTPCDLPDINTLMQYSMKAEYETPLEYMKNYTGTPLIDNGNTKLNRSVAESESDWSETDDELLEPGIKKAKRDKHLQKKHKKDKARANKEAERSSQEAEARRDDSNDEKDSQSGSQKSKSSKTGPPVAPKPKKSSTTNTSSESLNSTGSQSKTNSTDATSQGKTASTESLEAPPVAPGSPGREAPVSFEESAPEKPQLKSYRRPQGPRGRKPPLRYSSHALSQTMSTTLSQIMA